MAEVTLDGVRKLFGSVTAVEDFTLSIGNGEFVVFVGPSGCGKSTTLRMLAGLEDVSSGSILIDGRAVNNIHPKDRDIAMVFQNYALYPHLNVFDNMSFGLRAKRLPRAEIESRTHEAAASPASQRTYCQRRSNADRAHSFETPSQCRDPSDECC